MSIYAQFRPANVNLRRRSISPERNNQTPPRRSISPERVKRSVSLIQPSRDPLEQLLHNLRPINTDVPIHKFNAERLYHYIGRLRHSDILISDIVKKDNRFTILIFTTDNYLAFAQFRTDVLPIILFIYNEQLPKTPSQRWCQILQRILNDDYDCIAKLIIEHVESLKK